MAEAVATQVCPVCSECLEEPKLLPCAHLLCKKCVLATVEKTGEKPSGCPSCRHSILPEHQMGDIDLAVFVDSLPTDHVTWMKIQNQKLLSDTATCSVCDTETDSKSEATVFCFQCGIKLCRNCAKCHRKLPSSSDHTVEELSTLTAETVAAKKCMSCNLHKDRAVEKYCSSHRELVCLLCAWSGHKDCDGVEDIELSAERESNDLAEQNKRLKQRETSLSDEIEMLDKQIREAEAKFARMREEVISTCTDIIKCYEAQKHKLLDDIDQKEQEFLEEKLANRDQLEALKSDMAAHTISVDQMMSSAPGKALLATLGRLKSRLHDLETKKPVTSDEATVGEVYFDVKMLDHLKESADKTGRFMRSLKPIELKEIKGNLFNCRHDDALAHSVSEDLAMDKGIAVMFKKHFGGVGQLRAQEKKVGDVATLYRDGNFVYYLITKRCSNHKPTLQTVENSLIAMRNHMVENKVTSLSMPTIGCGLSGLDWGVVSDIIRDVFMGTGIRITIYHYDGM